MIKRTLYFGNPAYLSKRNEQLVINLPDAKGIDNLTKANTIPIEDIGVVILDNQQITITHGLMESLLKNNVALITCDNARHPVGLMLNLCCNTVQQERYDNQINASQPLKKQLWQQTIRYKIQNQAKLLNNAVGANVENMYFWAEQVKSGDTDNHEARAAAYFWQNLFPHLPEFRRRKDGIPPNHLFNYGYAILRGIMARSLVGSGLLPTLGIFHRNRYNAYCLADDIMEPYRPFVDKVVVEMIGNSEPQEGITKEQKIQLLSIPSMDVEIDGLKRPLMLATTITTASLHKCFEGTCRKISYPSL